MTFNNLHSKKIRIIAMAVMGTSIANEAFAAAPPAFPGATGPGAIATGGRGGDVYHVTRLDADKAGTLPGSLQYGINNAGAGRTIVFDVGGTIYLAGQSANDTLRYGKSNITVAGQTAPGPGITIAGTATKWTGSNVIVRNLTVRPNLAPVTYDAFSLQTKNSIFDHVTATWFTDEGISITDAGENSTIQYANISEGLNDAGHAFGAIVATEVDGTQYSYNHNLFAHNASRMPRLGSEIGAVGAVTDFTNNVVYDWSATKAGYSGTGQNSSTNFRSNYYIRGYNNGSTMFDGGDDLVNFPNGITKVYEDKNNKFDSNKNGVVDGSAVTGTTYFRGSLSLVGSAFNVSGMGTPDTADVALQRVIDYGGANWQNRNPIDARIMNSVKDGSGRGINDLTGSPQSTEWTTILSQRPDAGGNAPFQRAANFDTDKDGMPDTWEVAHGLNPATSSNNADFDNDGYTNLEEYINDLGAWPAGKALVFSNSNGNGRFEEIGNWDNIWQPSRFDTAQINAGSVSINSPGQHAKQLAVAAGSSNTASLNVSAGWIDILDTLNVGSSGTATLNQSGGLVRAGTSVTIGNSIRAGTYALSGGTLATPMLTKANAASAFTFTGGVLHADTINFSLINNGGTIAPGSDAQLQQIAAASMPDITGATETVQPFIGTTHIAGSLTLQSGLLQIDLASLSSFDRISVDGALSLGGSLGVVLDNGYVPTPGSQWLIGAAGSISGEFNAITPGFTTQRSGGNLFLLVVPEPSSLWLLSLAWILGSKRKPKARHVPFM
jgi:hypothetical protein